MNTFVDISDDALATVYRAMAVIAFFAVFVLIVRFSLLGRLFTGRVFAKKTRMIVSGVVMTLTSTATFYVVQVPVVAAIVLISTFVIMACLSVPNKVRNAAAWLGECLTFINEVLLQLLRLAVMLGRATTTWWATR